MAAPSTMLALLDASTCYRLGALNPVQQKALLLLAKGYGLKGAGGTDFTADLAAITLACPPLTDDQMTAANIAIAFANATNSGATVPATLDLKLAEVRCLQHLPGGMLTMNRIELELNRLLGANKAYPQ